MANAWKHLDLHGDGLQQANLQLARQLRQRHRAYLLLLAFPLGAHRVYLREPLGAWTYRVLAATAVALLALAPRWSVVPAVLLAGFVAFDLVWIERRVARLNKRLRMQAYLRPRPGAPSGFRGHYVDSNDDEVSPASRAPSFAEQERLLAEIERRRRPPRA